MPRSGRTLWNPADAGPLASDAALLPYCLPLLPLTERGPGIETRLHTALDGPMLLEVAKDDAALAELGITHLHMSRIRSRLKGVLKR